MKYVDLMDDPESRVYKTVLVADINGSTQMKERDPEITWIPTFFRFYDLVRQIVTEEGGTVTKYVGDGVVAIFGEDDAAHAINAAIRIQEQIADAVENRRVRFTCSIGIAYGEVFAFPISEGVFDYLGLVVDRAFRLSGVANAKAVFVDAETVSAAAMNKIRSLVGVALRRKVADYQGSVEKVSLKGFNKPVLYHEIWWAADRYGVSTGFVTEEADASGASSKPVTSAPVRPVKGAKDAWLHGYVKRWGAGFGFIATGEEDFYFNRDYLFSDAFEVRESSRVVFLPLDSLEPGKSRRADKIFVLGGTVRGHLTHVHSRGFGFAEVTNQHGDVHNLFVLLGNAADFQQGQVIECEIGENQQGPIGLNARVTEMAEGARL